MIEIRSCEPFDQQLRQANDVINNIVEALRFAVNKLFIIQQGQELRSYINAIEIVSSKAVSIKSDVEIYQTLIEQLKKTPAKKEKPIGGLNSLRDILEKVLKTSVLYNYEAEQGVTVFDIATAIGKTILTIAHYIANIMTSLVARCSKGAAPTRVIINDSINDKIKEVYRFCQLFM
ncbi:hypothetical protein CHS0354_042154 [Potamilus streckersoni]|uniref:Uncharacterized protein n=1 Tax=Potamilus streckersoni TaxID=2493646 RepID=A0AAE0TLJ5_9BIVA|nr:hypothetical protein CHS0354_042154 [Potamilus streckersoni]